uniref:Tetratricopeptide repeat protein 37 n=1 Tax=Diabrotica virgifera virgifera TaxID=50390 RepID=A0A6P7G2Q1_DIAVI
MKDVKALLKEAREAIKNKKFDVALKLSKSILREDKTNYMALVFLGLALQEVGPVEQACKAFQKAIEHNPTNPLAWNGLVIYYEKSESDEAKNKLVDAYLSALKVETNTKKILEYSEKLCTFQNSNNLADITNAVFNCSTKLESDSPKMFNILAKFYMTLNDTPSELLAVFETCFSELLKLRDYRSVQYFSSYINLLYRQHKYEEVFEIAEEMQAFFENDIVSLVWLCKVYNQLFVEESKLVDKFNNKIKEYFPKLLSLEPKNAIGLFTKGIQLFLDSKLIDCKEILNEVCNLRPGLVHAWVFLMKICSKLNHNDDAMQAYLSATKLLKSTKYTNNILGNILTDSHLTILSKSKNEKDWTEAVEIYKNMLDEKLKSENLENIILAFINLKDYPTAQQLLDNLESQNELNARFLKAKLCKAQMKFDEALSILESDTPDITEWFMEIGLIYWTLKDYKKSLIPFLKASKCDPNNYICFLSLGNYYQKIEDFDKARRCYEKAFNLNKSSQELVEKLSKIYTILKKWDSTQNLLEAITVGPINQKNCWAWLQLGLCYLEQENYSKAIEKLQFVVRVEKENTNCWQCLADAYFARGSYVSALRCYEKSLEYTENTLYPCLQIANIKKTMGLYDEACAEFKEILLNNQQCLPALKGLSETYLYQAKDCYRDQRLGTVRNHLQDALNYVTLAIKQNKSFSCLWKILADVCVFITNLPDNYCYLNVTQELVAGKDKIEREDLFHLATTCYCKAISLNENNLLWHDLSSCYLKHAKCTANKTDKEMLLSYAMTAAKHCATSNPKYWQHWNLLGNIAMEKTPPDYALAQHYFIKAVTVENNNPVSWGNLGILYFIVGDIKLANKAFAQGQRSDPNYVNNWIGQALIAESMGVEEAMDLFRHSVQLSHHQQGAIGYAHWVCRTLLEAPQKTLSYSIEEMHAIPVACDAMTWYTENNDKDGCAWTMLGILKERLKLNIGSLEAFKNAYDCSPNHRDLTRVNYGRLLSKHEKYVQAITIFQEVEAATFSSGSGLALALFKSQHYEESYAAYDQALHWLTEEQSHQSELLVALASMAYMFQGLEGAKTLLFQSIQLKPPSPWGLYATLALGLVHRDFELAELVLKELEQLKDNKDCLPHYGVLLCLKLLRKEKPDRAVKELSKLVHRHPDNANIWLVLAITILRVKSEHKRALAAVKCCQIAFQLGQSNMDITKILGCISLGHLLAGDIKSVLVSAQKAIYCYPNLVDGWAVLLAALVKDKNRCSKEFVSNIFHHVMNLNPPEILINWLKKIKNTLE